MRVATAIAELLDLGEQRTAVPLPSLPTLPQVVAEGLCHAGPRLHPVALRQCVQPQPPIQPPPIDSQMGCDLTDVQSRGFHPPHRLKQLQLLLAALPSRLRFLLTNTGADPHPPVLRRFFGEGGPRSGR